MGSTYRGVDGATRFPVRFSFGAEGPVLLLECVRLC